MEKSASRFQMALIVLGLVAAIFFAIFLWREIFPEYKIFQNNFIELETFRQSYTGEPSPVFKTGVKQIVLEQPNNAPPVIDRCVSCHVALEIPDYSPTKVAKDLNGKVIFDAEGLPLKVPNETYIFTKLDEKIASTQDPTEKRKLESLKSRRIGEIEYDMRKVQKMHPLIGREMRPFEFHPIEEYGCVSCHNGNGRALTIDKAHGPVFDHSYEVEKEGHVPSFLESDENDPPFSKVFNHKPSDQLIFQTTPIFPGALIQAKCIQCHLSGKNLLENASQTAEFASLLRQKKSTAVQEGYLQAKEEVKSLLSLKKQIQKEGLKKIQLSLNETIKDPKSDKQVALLAKSQLEFLGNAQSEKEALKSVNDQLIRILGEETLILSLEKNENGLEAWIASHKDATGELFQKKKAAELDQTMIQHATVVNQSFSEAVMDPALTQQMVSDVDVLTKNYQRGKEQYQVQACYACHRIAGFARGGVGPELTFAGQNYPWFLKESIVWPQADVKTSSMPNFKLDHVEIEDLMTFLLGQKGESKANSGISYSLGIQKWDAGKKTAWEESIPPQKMEDVSYGMTVFATEGCAACHRLKGYDSDVGFLSEKKSETGIFQSKSWFEKLFPETILGSDLVAVLQNHKEEIDEKIIHHAKKPGLLEQIEKTHPGTLIGFYPSFRFAMRAKSHLGLSSKESALWDERVQRVLMAFIQEYGLGRLIGPRPNWSGIYRTDEWLMEHFKKPSAHVPRSIMPVFPFDDTKFYALTHMLNALGIVNRDQDKKVWKEEGFNPETAFKQYCSQCHGEQKLGNGPVAEWIYPIPKNLHNPEFLRGLTKERVLQSIIHGVKGTPMPPFGEVAEGKRGPAVLSQEDAVKIVEWLFSSFPNRSDVVSPKWNFQPLDFVQSLKNEGDLSSDSQTGISAVFEQKEAAFPGADQKEYFIKKEFYTPEHLEAGKAFYLVNCATCHGGEGDGQGVRAEAMKEAKPRMLTNIDWLDSRDDMRLLRSIKFGVPGTAMTPWGDLTSSLQQLELVVFIRSLSKMQDLTAKLSSALYQAFSVSELFLESARAPITQQIDKGEKAIRLAKEQETALLEKLTQDQQALNTASKRYEEKIQAYQLVSKLKKQDAKIVHIKELLAKEAFEYKEMGSQLLALFSDNESLIDSYLKIVLLNQGRYLEDKDTLTFTDPKGAEEKREQFQKQLTLLVKNELARIDLSLEQEKGKMSSPLQKGRIAELEHKKTSLEKLLELFQRGFFEIARLREQQKMSIAKT